MKNIKSLPRVSVIIPVFNNQKYLTKCLESVISQSYPNIEIICIDDGSTDNSLEVLRQYEKNNDNIKVLAQKNAGVIDARNIAIKKATGEYILPLDSDDYISYDLISKLYDTLTKDECAVAAPAVEFTGRFQGPYNTPDPTAKNMALQNCIVNCALFKKELWEKYGGYDKRFKDGIEDYDFWWNFLQDGKTIKRNSDAIFFYRIKRTTESRNLKNIEIHKQLENIMLSKYPLMRSLRLKGRVKNKIRKIVKTPKNVIKKSLRATNILKWRKYKGYVLGQPTDKSHFVPITDTPLSKNPTKKLIAYYLPQYYQIPQNDEWFGKGFTEWTNTTKAVPQFTGHWQPHLPIDVGFYNLESTHTMYRQIELAKMYGIYGFCFYYYWFTGGNKIMEKPINNFLNDKGLDFPFMFFWANEDWTNTWGEQADVGTKTFSAKMKHSDVKKFVDDIIPFLKDSRYIKIDDRPHIIIYQAKKDPYLPTFIEKIGDLIEKNGVNRPYISLVFPDDSPDKFNPKDYGADAAVEFGVHMRVRPDYIQDPVSNPLINPAGKLLTYDMHKFINEDRFKYDVPFPIYKGAMTTFDNTARKIETGAYLFSLSPYLYKTWLSEIIATSKTDYIFLSAWNEWAEGMHLEPDSKFGYAYLQATKDALEENI